MTFPRPLVFRFKDFQNQNDYLNFLGYAMQAPTTCKKHGDEIFTCSRL